MPIDDLAGSTLSNAQMVVGDDQLWLPTRRIAGLGNTDLWDQFSRIRKVVDDNTATITTATATAAPFQVSGVSATESPFRTKDGSVKSNVSVSFTTNPSDPNYDHVQIWFTGYNGNSNPQLMPGDSRTSPASFLCDTTNETVTVTVVAVGPDGTTADFALAPTTTVLLDGVVSAPAAPSIAQSLIATPTGYQFSFNQLSGLSADQVDGYQVYRNTTNVSGTASKFQYFKHNPTNSAPQVVFDSVPNGTTYFYWVTAVNTTGLESVKTAAQSGTVGSGSILGPDGNPHSWTGLNLVFNGDFTLYAAPTGLQETLASSIRTDETDNAGGAEQSANGWTRNFESGGNGEGVVYRTAQSSFPAQGTWSLLLQDRQSSTNDSFAAVSDAFPVIPGRQYRVSALVNAGFVTGFPTHATWFFRILFYKNGTTDFSRSSASLSANTPSFIGWNGNSSASTGLLDIASSVSLTGNQTPAATVTAPSDAAWARIAFYHWNDGTAVASAWNLLVGNVRCYPISIDGDAIYTVSTLLNGQGGMVPNQAFSISYSSTSTSISLSWSSASLLRADGSTLSVSSGTQNYTSLTPSTTYWIYAYINVIAGTIGFANGSPPGTSSNSTTAAQAGLDGRVPLTPISVALPASGGGPSGSGGDGGSTCPEAAELVEVQGKGQIRAGDVQAGDWIKGYSFTQQQEVYRFVLSVVSRPCASWRMVNAYRVSPCESVYFNNQWMAAFRVPGATIDTMIGDKILITVQADEDNEHNYYLVGGQEPLLIHNFIIIPRC